ncbi:P27 family phage terminase small subunit [Streptomyces sp. cmx-4-7]|uniref:P27 family phage terminase small subunit n=1 Tax=Streptomyces sp. cmx-4-7 TaxID=2790939 RepID=UPI00397F1E53
MTGGGSPPAPRLIARAGGEKLSPDCGIFGTPGKPRKEIHGRPIPARGLTVTAERGTVKNGAAAIAAQYRSQLSRYIRGLGLSPSSRTAITRPGPDDDDSDIWD